MKSEDERASEDERKFTAKLKEKRGHEIKKLLRRNKQLRILLSGLLLLEAVGQVPN